jgi:cytochrome bd-type quinol oxidase subunit 2
MRLAKALAGISSVGSSLYLASATFADPGDASSIIGEVKTVNKELMPFIKDIINWAIGIAALVCVVMLIFAGYTYITASGEEDKIQKATKTLTWAIVGLVVCFIAVILVQFVLKNFLGEK